MSVTYIDSKQTNEGLLVVERLDSESLTSEVEWVIIELRSTAGKHLRQSISFPFTHKLNGSIVEKNEQDWLSGRMVRSIKGADFSY